MFSGEELRHFVDIADFVTVNDYEAKLLEQRTGEDMQALAKRVKALVVTRGGEGSLDFMPMATASTFPVCPPMRWSIRPAAATPIARACSTALPTVGPGTRPDGSRPSWARSKSPARARKTTSQAQRDCRAVQSPFQYGFEPGSGA